ncbi:hypothetical protein GCM10011611_50490 [Aliidongia dinghuensis]|uniref:TIGR02444 family protein n=1 Tax=Aliidongia dinghuensis TaxID=1867774 RepID=A0A8J2YXT5_9PROT|nr:TIGR02444 family protein [Aliidongia dinghuensis]GGF38022.1 hypothetical protein GCM10011611_50490 [Aliidongia dinghuensis]
MGSDFEGQASDFWGFAHRLYEDTSALCLDLQDGAGLDVNLVLLCLWAGTVRGLALTDEDFPALDAALEPWRTRVVAPLRAVRRFLKGDSLATELRERIKAAELDAERVEQRRLLAALPDRPLGEPSPALGLINLERYAGPAAARAFTPALVAAAASDPRPSA